MARHRRRHGTASESGRRSKTDWLLIGLLSFGGLLLGCIIIISIASAPIGLILVGILMIVFRERLAYRQMRLGVPFHSFYRLDIVQDSWVIGIFGVFWLVVGLAGLFGFHLDRGWVIRRY